jgi:hypothetical protein
LSPRDGEAEELFGLWEPSTGVQAVVERMETIGGSQVVAFSPMIKNSDFGFENYIGFERLR